MIKNKTKHTFILTIDNKTAEAAKANDVILGKLRVLLLMNQMTFEDGKIQKAGIHFMRVVEA